MPPFQKISHTTITFQSDIPSSDRLDHNSGILHIVKNTNNINKHSSEHGKNKVRSDGDDCDSDNSDDSDSGDSSDSGDNHDYEDTARDNDVRGSEKHMFIWLQDKTHVENVDDDDDNGDDDDDNDGDDGDDDDDGGDDYGNDGNNGNDGLLSQLIQQGYNPTKMFFLPYSSKANWLHRYPHAVPCMECDEDGRINDPIYFQQHIRNGPPNAAIPTASSAASYNASNNSNTNNNSDAIIRPTNKKHNNKKRNRQSNTTNFTSSSSSSSIIPKLPKPPTTLFDLEHCQYHIQIYNYFSSLHSNLLDMSLSQTKQFRKYVLPKAGVSITGIRDLLTNLERAFGNVREFHKNKNKRREDENELATKGGDEDEEGSGDDDDDDDDTDGKNDDENGDANNNIINNEDTVNGENEKEKDDAAPSSSSNPAFPLLNIMEEKKKYSHLPPSPPFAEVDESDLILLPLSCGKLGLSLQFYKSVIGAVVSGIDAGCKFQQYITIGDRLITIDGNVISTGRDISEGKDKKIGRLFGIAKKGMSEERLNQLSVEEYGYSADTPTMTREDDAAIRCVVSRGKKLPDDIQAIINSRRHWPPKIRRIQNFASESLTYLRLYPGIHHAIPIDNFKTCTLCCVTRDIKRKTKTISSTCQIPLCIKLIGDATETCFEKWHSREDLHEAHMEQCGHLLEQRRRSRESGRWSHARSVRRRTLEGSGGGADVAPMEVNEDENSMGGDGDGVIKEDAVPEEALEDAPVEVEEDGSLV